MTDLFHRLAARALGNERQLRPQVQGLFEPQGYLRDAGFSEEIEEISSEAEGQRPTGLGRNIPTGRREQSAPRPTPASAIPAAAGTADFVDRPDDRPAPLAATENDVRPAAPRSRQDPPPAAHQPGLTPTAPRGADPSLATPEPQAMDDAAALGAAAAVARADATAPGPAHDRPGRRQPNLQAARVAAPAAAPPQAAQPTGQPEASTSTSPSLRPGGQNYTSGDTASAPALHAAARRLAEAGDAETFGWRRPSGRQVHIHIDHIEVRQQTRPAAEPPKRARPANPAPDLSDYLRRRRS